MRSQSAAFQVVEVGHLGISILWDDLLVSLAIDSLHLHWHHMSSNWSTISEMPKRILSLSAQAGVTKAKSVVDGFLL